MYKKTALGLPLRMDWPPPTWVCASHRLVSYGSRSAAGIMGGVYSPGIPLALLKRARESALQTRIQILCLSRTYVHIYTMRRGLTINPFPESPSPPPTRPPTPRNSFNKINSFHLFVILCSRLVYLLIRYFPETISRCIYLSIYLW